jgi:hypothetical protein
MLNWLQQLKRSRTLSKWKPSKPLPFEPRSEAPWRSVNDIDELHQQWAWFWPIVNEGARMFDGSLVSGIRSKARNRGVKGHPESRHLLGLAADVTFAPDNGRTARDRCHECFAYYREQGLRGYIRDSGTSLHIQDRAAQPPERSNA